MPLGCRSTLVFAVNVDHIKSIVNLFRENGIDARGMDGGTDAGLREDLIHDFAAQKYPVLVNCGISLSN